MNAQNITTRTGWDRENNAYTYHKCESCGLETTDDTVTDHGCPRCSRGSAGGAVSGP